MIKALQFFYHNNDLICCENVVQLAIGFKFKFHYNILLSIVRDSDKKNNRAHLDVRQVSIFCHQLKKVVWPFGPFPKSHGLHFILSTDLNNLEAKKDDEYKVPKQLSLALRWTLNEDKNKLGSNNHSEPIIIRAIQCLIPSEIEVFSVKKREIIRRKRLKLRNKKGQKHECATL